jgi:hypothetical protein
MRGQVAAVSVEIEALPAVKATEQGVAILELGSHLLMGLVLFEGLVSGVTGVALLMVTSPRTEP